MQGHRRSTVHLATEREETLQLQSRMEAAKLQAEQVMAGIITPLCSSVSAHPQHITDAYRSVFTDAPETLNWMPCPGTTACWVAEANDVYTVNLLSGAALCNGHAPSHLPQSIVEHPVYQDVFSGMVFDVYPEIRGGQVTYHTVHSIHGCVYTWRLTGGKLYVTETCNGQTLELLPCAPLHTACNILGWRCHCSLCCDVEKI